MNMKRGEFRSRAQRTLLAMSLLAGLLGSTAANAEKGVAWYAHSLKWYEQHSYWRLGAGRVIYLGSSTPANIENAQGETSAAIASGPIAGSSAGINNNNTIAGELGFILPFLGEHLSVEVAIAPPLKLDFQAEGTLASQPLGANAFPGPGQGGNNQGDPVPTGTQPLGKKLGTIHALPPAFTLVYRPWLHTLIQPYIGVGAVWLFTYNINVTNPVLTQVQPSTTQLVLSRPVGCVAQGGFDVRLPWGFKLTADARYLGCATVHAELRGTQVYANNVSPVFGPANVGTISTNVAFRAVLVQLSIGSTFWGQ